MGLLAWLLVCMVYIGLVHGAYWVGAWCIWRETWYANNYDNLVHRTRTKLCYSS